MEPLYNLSDHFDNIYRTSAWGTESGPGSDAETFKGYIEYLQNFLRVRGVKSIVDCGCGHLQLIKQLDLTGIDYIGIDVAKSVIDKHLCSNPLPSAKSITFLHMDASNNVDDLPSADLLICKDVLQHLTNKQAAVILSKIHRFKYALITNDSGDNITRDQGVMIPPCYYTGLDIHSHPFNIKGNYVHTQWSKKTYLYERPRPFCSLNVDPKVLLAILVKDASGLLDLYLSCIENLDYPKKCIHLYIRTNNNKDDTKSKITTWVSRVGNWYGSVETDYSDVEDKVEQFGNHEWNPTRFKVLAEIREVSLRRTLYNRCDFYFVCDADNFVVPHTLRDLVDVNLPIVAPLLRLMKNDGGLDWYANIHDEVTATGHYADSTRYPNIISGEYKCLLETKVVHCTYLVKADVIPLLTYKDNSGRYEYVVFAESARKNGVPQYIDTRSSYGTLILKTSTEGLPFLGYPYWKK